MTRRLWLLVAFLACTETGDAPRAAARDSAGVWIVENPAAATWSLSPQPRLEVGVADGEEAYQLSGVVGAVLTSRGELVVANGGSSELRFYDQTGRHFRTVGGEGDGPGEFSRLNGLERSADSLMASDGRFRITVFDESGAVLEMTPPGDTYVGRMTGGTLVSYTIAPRGELVPGTHTTSTLVLLGQRGAARGRDTLARYVSNRQWIDSEVAGFSAPMFGAQARSLIDRDRIWIADGLEGQIQVVNSRGVLMRSIRNSSPGRPVTQADRDRAIEARRQRYSGAPAELVEQRVGPYERQPTPALMPAYGRSSLFRNALPWLLRDEAGGVWVQSYVPFPDEAPRWLAHDSEGHLVASVAVPEGFQISWIGTDAVVGRWLDALDVERVQVYDLNRE